MSSKRKTEEEISESLNSSNHPLTDEQLSAVSILLEIGVYELYRMSLKTISSKVKKAARSMKLSPEEAFLKVGAQTMVYDSKFAIGKLVKVLGLK